MNETKRRAERPNKETKMANVTMYLSTDMSDTDIWYGTVVAYDSSHVRIETGSSAQEYYGHDFTYNEYAVTGGTVTGTKEWSLSGLRYSVTGASMPAVLLQYYLNQGDAESNVLAGNDTITGSPEGDVIYLYSGNDTVFGGGGDDVVWGGDGVDVAKFTANKANFAITNWDELVIVKDQRGTLGEDALYNMERLIFSDAAFAVDTDAGEAGGMAYRIYQAAFDRTPDIGGVSYWLEQIDNGMDLIEVSARFIDSQEFRNQYGSAPSNQDFVEKLYRNVLDRAGEASGVTYWVGQLDSGAKSHAKVLADFSESIENVELVGASIGSGFWYEA